jgi:glycine betaine/choline ABC-type transport system substrate-binding protein
MKMMTRLAVLALLLCCWPPTAQACTSFPIHLGAVDTPKARILIEMISTIITERSGVVVGISYFEGSPTLYEAVVQKKVHLIIEDTSTALGLLQKPVAAEQAKNLEMAKGLYKQEKDMVWLEPFPALASPNAATAPVITSAVLAEFPALPRLLKKLAAVLTTEDLAKLLALVESGQKPRTAAKEYLAAKRLI